MFYLSTTVICVSKSVFKKRLAKFKRILENKNKIVYNGVDTRIFCMDKAARDNFRFDLGINRHVLFGVVGNITPHKGQDLFLEGLAAVKRNRPGLPIKGLMIGRMLDRKYHANLEKMMRKHNLENDVIFLDYDENIKKIYSALDVFVLPTQREGFSRSVLEAMSTGLPVIATRLSEIEEAVIDGENAILIEPNDIDEMANAIIHIFSQSDLRTKMGQKNRKRAIDNFDLNSHLSAVQSLYEQLIDDSCSEKC
jgi:glycosyltransferase involved in cell wall biosynthesis